MKVGINLTNLHKFSKGRGIGFYAENLINALKKYTEIDVVVIENKYSNKKVDLIHYPYFDFFRTTLPLFKKYPTVITIHDVIPLKFPSQYPPGLKGKLKYFVQLMALMNVKALITDSNSSKKDINEILKIQNNKIFPIYLAASERFRKITDNKRLKAVGEKYNLPSKFALYVGSVNYNKNLQIMVQACINSNLDLVLVGGDFIRRDNLTHPELNSFKNFLNNFANHSKVHMVGFVNDEDLVSIYNLADVTLLVSLYEGFGLSILESQSCGTPVVTSNISSMPEVAGEAALFVNPENINEVTKAIKKIEEDRKFRENLIQEGIENSQKFSWEKTARETSKVYLDVFNNV